jgi:uncharacterized protein (DUF305 family)
MIRHHQGAIDMVDVLFKAYGAAQDETVFKFANDVQADQSVEINVMKDMLEQVGKDQQRTSNASEPRARSGPRSGRPRARV